LDPRALRDQVLTVIEEQLDLALGSGQDRGGKRVHAFLERRRATASASIGSDLPASRELRLRPAINFGATRTTRSPRASRNRSSFPDTFRQSSIAHTRSGSNPRAQAISRSCPALVALTVSLLRSSPLAAPTAEHV
jgi:hypothetical protein